MQNEQKTEQILESLGGLQKAMAPDFFYTRLLGRMQREAEPVKEKIFLLRPAFITAALSLVLIINVFSLVKLDRPSGNRQYNQTNKPATIESFAEAYDMNSVTVYE